MKSSVATTNTFHEFAYRRRKANRLTAVDAILTKTLKKYGLNEDLSRYKFVLSWKEIVGEDIAKHATPEGLKAGRLLVRVANSAWAQELSFQKEIIINRLNRFLGQGQTVNDVMFVVGR